MVTPVDVATRAKLVRTRGDRADDFVGRVNTTLEFIEFIRANEEAFADPSLLREESRALFSHYLPMSHLPWFWKKMAAKYRERLEGLRTSLYRPSIPEAWWDEALRRPLFAEAGSGQETMAPKEEVR
jgi:hypothetical protein